MPRLFEPLEFILAIGALGSVGLAVSTLFNSPLRYLRALAIGVAFPVAVWSVSPARQIVYEMRTGGVVSSQIDTLSCVALR